MLRDPNLSEVISWEVPTQDESDCMGGGFQGIGKIVCLTEHVPVQDTMYALSLARERAARVVGPNTAGLVTTGESFVGFMPAFNPRVFKPGSIGVVSSRQEIVFVYAQL